jgi:hypothetical protein
MISLEEVESVISCVAELMGFSMDEFHFTGQEVHSLLVEKKRGTSTPPSSSRPRVGKREREFCDVNTTIYTESCGLHGVIKLPVLG